MSAYSITRALPQFSKAVAERLGYLASCIQLRLRVTAKATGMSDGDDRGVLQGVPDECLAGSLQLDSPRRQLVGRP